MSATFPAKFFCLASSTGSLGRHHFWRLSPGLPVLVLWPEFYCHWLLCPHQHHHPPIVKGQKCSFTCSCIIPSLAISLGVVQVALQVWVAHKVTSNGLWSGTFYAWQVTVTRKDHNIQHEHTTNMITITMVAEPPTLLVACIWWIHTAQGVGGLVHIFPMPSLKGKSRFNKLKDYIINNLDLYVFQ